MSAVVVVVVDGVLTKRDQLIPIADPDLNGLRLVRALYNEFGAIGYLSVANPALVRDWLAAIDAPAGLWVGDAADKTDTLAHVLGTRSDRAVLFVDSSPESFDELSRMRIPVLHYHSEPWVVGDWRRESSWAEPDEPIDDSGHSDDPDDEVREYEAEIRGAGI